MLRPNFDELIQLRKSLKIAAQARQKPATIQLGSHASKIKGRGLDFSEFREYSAGDDVRTIDWRVTSRTGRPHTKLFTEEKERQVYLFIDLNSYMDFGTKKTFKSVQAARIAALLAWNANAHHDLIGAVLFGAVENRVRILRAKRTRKVLWDLFALLVADRKESAPVDLAHAIEASIQRIPSGSRVYIISDFFRLDEPTCNEVMRLSQKTDLSLLRVTDPAETKLPKVGVLSFFDAYGKKLLVRTEDEKAGNKYEKFWKASREKLQQLALRLRIPIYEVSTDDDLIVRMMSEEGRRALA